MHKQLALATVMALALLVSGCKEDHESLLKDSLSKMKEVVSVLEGVKDEASAKSAAPKLEKLNGDMKTLKEKMDKMGKPSAEEDKRLQNKYEKEMQEVVGKLMKESMRVGMDPKLSKAIGPAMEKMGK